MRPRQLGSVLALGLVALLALALLRGADLGTEQDDTVDGVVEVGAGEPAADTPLDAETPLGAEATATFSDLPTVAVEQLPPEALDTLVLIGDGGPYPFGRDDLVFQNREGLLPDRQLGHYREYTVITPGEDDRGARRVVAGADGERYYTADHYVSFAGIVFAARSG